MERGRSFVTYTVGRFVSTTIADFAIYHHTSGSIPKANVEVISKGGRYHALSCVSSSTVSNTSNEYHLNEHKMWEREIRSLKDNEREHRQDGRKKTEMREER